MMNATTWGKVVEKLTADTLAGQIKWSPNDDIHRDNLLTPVYVTHTLDKTIGVYRYRFQHFLPGNEPEWFDEIAIEFLDRKLDRKYEAIWRFPEVPGRESLLQAIQYSSSGADRFAEEFLKEAS